MDIRIPDQILTSAGLTEREFLVEVACRLWDAEILEKPDAVRLSGLERVEFENECFRRGLAVYRATLEDYELDQISRHKAPGGEDLGTRKAG